MFDLLIRFSIRNRFLVLLLAALLLAWGGWLASRLPVDVFPDLNRPTVSVMTEAGGMSPEEVEILVTRPLETAMNGAPGVERVRSQSAPGLSVIWVEFGWDVDIYRARQQVAERMGEVSGELEGLSPAVAPISSIMGEILLVGLSSPVEQVPGMKLRSLADTIVRPRLLALPGISQVTAIGGGVEELQVEVDPTALARFGLDLAVVRAAAAEAQGNSSGGFLERKSQEYLVRNLARSADPEVVGATVVALRNGQPIRLDQVAHVGRGRAVMRGDAGVNGNPAVILSIQKQPGADTLALTGSVEAALGELAPALGAGVEVTPLFRQADFIAAAVQNVEDALQEGVILVVLILLIFLMNLRTTAITLTAIPLSFVVSALVLKAMGMSVNTMTLGGLAVAIGELVDDAIVDVENVYRRLRENAQSAQPRPVVQVVFEASREVRNSIVYSTLLVALVFVPLFSLSGIEGRLFAPLGVAYITAILASMAVSLTVTPALCTWLLGGQGALKEEVEGRLVRSLKQLDRRLLTFFLPRPRLVILTTFLMVGLAAASVPFLGNSFLPTFYEGTATLSLQAAPGTSLGESNRLGRLAELQLLEIPEVAAVGRRTGRAEQDEHAEGVHSTEIDVDFTEGGRPRTEVLAEIRQRLGSLPGLSLTVGQPISHRLDHLLSGVRAAIAVKLFGTELGGLREAAGRIAEAMRPIPGM
ncbi:MAG TPA: efflux RND transporter permease subunit, partial [Myxococcota bacterium]|nr:efflux RND transporter permease subunit [Myxococcota bacterium]